jgi:hypothetical protein
MSRRANPTHRVMMDCIICLTPPNIKQTFDLHHVVYLIHNYLNHIPPTPMIYTDLESMRPIPKKKRSTRKDKHQLKSSKIKLDHQMNRDSLCMMESSLAKIFLSCTYLDLSYPNILTNS